MARARNRVRIVGGEWRSRIIRFPAAAALRPTPDRVRETLFNWLGQRLDGLRCIDVFAGSGALGFEALSRGAASVVMVESDRDTAEQLRRNARELGAQGARVVLGDAMRYLARSDDTFDVAFVDPPYASGLAPAAMQALHARLAPAARMYVESDKRLDAPESQWRVLREDRAGAVRYALYERVP